MRRQRWLVVALAAGCGGGERPQPAVVDTLPAAPAALAYLAELAGRYPAQSGMWTTEPLQSRLRQLLGEDYEVFLENVRTSGPVGVEGGLVYVTGNCPSSATVWGAGVLVADPAADRLLVKQYSEQWDSVRTYQEGEIAALPSDVMKVLAGWAEGMERGRKPAPAKKPEKQEPG